MITRSRRRLVQPEGGLFAAMSINAPEPRRRQKADSERPPKTLIVTRECDDDSGEDEVSSVDSPNLQCEESSSDEESESECDSVSSSSRNNDDENSESSDAEQVETEGTEEENDENVVNDDVDDDDDEDDDDEKTNDDESAVEVESDYHPDEETEEEDESVTTVEEDEDDFATRLRPKVADPSLMSTPLHVPRNNEQDDDASVPDDDSVAEQMINDVDDYDPDAETEDEDVSLTTLEEDEDELDTKLRTEYATPAEKTFVSQLKFDNMLSPNADCDANSSDDSSASVQEIGDEDFDEADFAEAFAVDDEDDEPSSVPLHTLEDDNTRDVHNSQIQEDSTKKSNIVLTLKEDIVRNDLRNPSSTHSTKSMDRPNLARTCLKAEDSIVSKPSTNQHQEQELDAHEKKHLSEKQPSSVEKNLKQVQSDLVEKLDTCKMNGEDGKENKSLHLDYNVASKREVNLRKGTNQTQAKKAVWREGVVHNGAWKLGSKIGSGAFGVVYIGMNTRNGQLIAVKSVKMEQGVMRDIRREIKVLKSLNHVNIVRYYGAEMDKNHLHIFQEWVPGGSLTGLLAKFGPFAVTVVRNYLSQILCGLCYLHENNILHRDIKGSNILVNDYGVVKLADFGASKQIAQLHDDLMMSLTMRGTPYYMAPEVFEERYSSKADIWSVGCVTVQMITGKPPWRDLGMTNPVALFKHIDQTYGPPALGNVTDELFLAMVERLFKRKAEERPSAKQLLSDPFIIYEETFDNDDVESRALFSPSIFSPVLAKNASRRHTCSPSPLPRGRRSSFGGTASPLLSPPLPSKSMMCGAGFSPVPDVNDWPTWAKHELVSQRQVNDTNVGQMVGKIISMTDSLALSDDSSDECSVSKLTVSGRADRPGSRNVSSESPTTLCGLKYCRSSVSS